MVGTFLFAGDPVFRNWLGNMRYLIKQSFVPPVGRPCSPHISLSSFTVLAISDSFDGTVVLAAAVGAAGTSDASALALTTSVAVFWEDKVDEYFSPIFLSFADGLFTNLVGEG